MSRGIKHNKVSLQTLFAEFVSQRTSGIVSLATMALMPVMKGTWMKLQALPEKTITYHSFTLTTNSQIYSP